MCEGTQRPANKGWSGRDLLRWVVPMIVALSSVVGGAYASGNIGRLGMLVAPSVVTMLIMIAVFAPCLLIAQRVWPCHRDHWALADLLFSLLMYPVLAWAAIQGAIELRSDVESRWRGVSFASDSFQLLYITRCFVHIFMMLKMKMKTSELVLMALHHVLSIGCYSGSFLSKNVHYFGCINGSCEVTNLFLNNVFLWKEVTVKGEKFEKYLPKQVVLANGVCLWVSYVIFRVLLFPYWFYQFGQDVMQAPELTWHRLPAFERYVYPAITGFIFLLSLYWFRLITKGLIKVLLSSGVKKSD